MPNKHHTTKMDTSEVSEGDSKQDEPDKEATVYRAAPPQSMPASVYYLSVDLLQADSVKIIIAIHCSERSQKG